MSEFFIFKKESKEIDTIDQMHWLTVALLQWFQLLPWNRIELLYKEFGTLSCKQRLFYEIEHSIVPQRYVFGINREKLVPSRVAHELRTVVDFVILAIPANIETILKIFKVS